MPQEYPIAQLHTWPLSKMENRLLILQEDHHLLRRYGQLELITLSRGQQTAFVLRSSADEVFAPIVGRAVVHLIDQRPASPTSEQTAVIQLDAENPEALLVPFGVAYAMSCSEDSWVLRLSTHMDAADPADQTFPWDVLQPFFPA